MNTSMILVLLLALATLAQGADLSIVQNGGRFLQAGDERLLELSSPWIATADYKQLARFPATSSAKQPTTRTETTAYGNWTETITPAPAAITIRYEFDLLDKPDAIHLQWNWRLEPANWNGTLADVSIGSGQSAMRAIDGLRANQLRQMSFMLPHSDVRVTCKASDGEWSFQDARQYDWARCYRLEYNRPVNLNGVRKGWFEVTINHRDADLPLVPLSEGKAVELRNVSFSVGPLRANISEKLSHILLLHTVEQSLADGQRAGEVVVSYADGQTASVPMSSGAEFTSLTDDVRSVHNGRLERLADGKVAWVSMWRNPRPGETITRVEPRTLAAGWKLLGATGIQSSADWRRAAMLLRGDGKVAAEESIISLDGTWQFSGGDVRSSEIIVPSFWDMKNEFRGIREATYSRKFDVPASFVGRRIALRFDAVGDGAEVYVNGRMAGSGVSPALPFEVDITGLVSVPSADNRLEVRVKDDSHYSVPREDVAWRNARHWIPRGMGGNSRKGLYQSVTLRARPAVRIADARIVTSVREGKLTVTYTLLNTTKEMANAHVAATVHAADGGKAVMTLPPATVDIPPYMTATVTAEAPFADVELWQPDHPTLYSLRSILNVGDTRHDRVDTRFGFREVWFDGPNFYLNGIRCNLRGESPAYSEKREMMATREQAQEMVRRYQAVNFNVLRFHSIPAPPHVLEVCDEMGMLVIDESAIYASWGMLMPEHPQFMDNCREHLTKWVRRDRNHPSVILWSAENEGLNVSMLSPAQLAEFARVINAEDGSRPVTFDGCGSGMGASPASVKHYVYTIDDLQHQGGKSSGYGRDLRNDIYWATEFKQDFPLGCGEFLFPYEPGLRDKEREVAYMMGLQTRGYRLANWFDIRPYNPSQNGFLTKDGVRKGYEEAYDIVVKSFAPVAVFDKAYDELGPYPQPPVLPINQPATRELIIYNDTFADESVEVEWVVTLAGSEIARDRTIHKIGLGNHITKSISFTPKSSGQLELTLISRKGGHEAYRDVRKFVVK